MWLVLTHSHLEQFEHFKAEHADCDVSKVSAAGTPACVVSVGVHVLLWQCTHILRCLLHSVLSHAEEGKGAYVGSLCVKLALVVIRCTFDNSSLLLNSQSAECMNIVWLIVR